MTQNSYICNFISAHAEDWEKILRKKYGIHIKKEDNYAIFNYTPESDFSDPIVQEARGIIIDTDILKVVCWPFRKFGNHVESYADTIDWSTARVQEKIDGSIIKLWFDPIKEKWQFSTNSTVRAENALFNEVREASFDKLIKKADNYSLIPFDRLCKEYTYIFELVSPEVQIIIKYPETSLFHIGTRSNVTGEEFDVDIGIKKPVSYPLSSLQECINAANALNTGNDNKKSSPEIYKEGFVVADAHGNRIKIKSPEYVQKHCMRNIKLPSKHACIDMLINNTVGITTLCETFPAFIPAFKYYKHKLSELKAQAEQMAVLARDLYEKYNKERSALEAVIAKNKLAIIGFRAIACFESGEKILLSLPIDKLAKLIPDYETD